MHYQRCKAGCVTAVEDEEGIIGEQRAALFEQRQEIVFDLEDFALWPTTKGGWIEDNALIATGAARFALDKLERIIDQPADRAFLEPRDFRIASRPIDHAFGCIDMHKVRASLAGGECTAACVAKEVEHMQIAVLGVLKPSTDQIAQP